MAWDSTTQDVAVVRALGEPEEWVRWYPDLGPKRYHVYNPDQWVGEEDSPFRHWQGASVSVWNATPRQGGNGQWYWSLEWVSSELV